MATIAEGELARRVWDRDRRLWGSPSNVDSLLGWLEYPAAGAGRLDSLANLADNAARAGLRSAVLLGMGGSSLTAEVIASLFDPSERGLRVFVLDSTVPGRIAAVESAIDIERTLFVAASKSGTTTEVWALVDHFFARLQEAGVEQPWHRFAAVSDPASPLAEFALANKFLAWLPGDPRVGGRYSAFTQFGLCAAGLMGLDMPKIVRAGEAARRASGRITPTNENPAAQLAAMLAGQSSKGRDKLTLISSPKLSRLGLWIEQLVAESLGKLGRGILPIVTEPARPPAEYGDDRFFVYLRLDGDDNAAGDRRAGELTGSSRPLLRIDLPDEMAVLSEFFRWMLAVAIAGELISVNPFDQPNVQLAKDTTAALLEDLSKGRSPSQFNGPELAEWLSAGDPAGYVAVLAYCREDRDCDRALENLAQRLSDRGANAVTTGYGPRYLHSTGQFHKGGPANGSFLFLTQPVPANEPAIAGRSFGFGALAATQAAGDRDTLSGLGRNVIEVTLNGDPATAILQLAKSI